MSVVNSIDAPNGRIELSNGWNIKVGSDSDTAGPQTIIGIFRPDGTRYDTSHVLMNTESPPEVVDSFADSVDRISSLDQLERLEQHSSQSVRELVRLLPEFDSQGNVV